MPGHTQSGLGCPKNEKKIKKSKYTRNINKSVS